MSNEELINEENSVNNVSESEVKKEVNIEDGHVLTKEELDSLSPSKALALPLNQYPEDKPLLEIKDIDIVFGRGRKKFKAVSDVSFNIFNILLMHFSNDKF